MKKNIYFFVFNLNKVIKLSISLTLNKSTQLQIPY